MEGVWGGVCEGGGGGDGGRGDGGGGGVGGGRGGKGVVGLDEGEGGSGGVGGVEGGECWVGGCAFVGFYGEGLCVCGGAGVGLLLFFLILRLLIIAPKKNNFISNLHIYQVKLLKYFLEKGADAKMKAMDGRLPIHFFLERGYERYFCFALFCFSFSNSFLPFFQMFGY